jgi:integrase
MMLDQTTVDKLTLADGQFFFDSDPAVRGFALRLRLDAKGRLAKTYIVQYRTPLGQRRRTIGNAARMRADVARKKAAAWISQVEAGNDPAAANDEVRRAAAFRFDKVVGLYLALKETKVRQNSLRLMRLYLTGTYFQPLHSKSLAKITRKDIAPCLNSIEAESGSITASRCRAHLSAFFAWSITQGHVDANPVIGTEKPKTGPARNRVLTDNELALVWGACKENDFGKIVRLLLLTGARRKEIGGLRWSEIDLDGATITIPAERSKNHHEHVLPLVPAALDILRSMPRRVNRDYVFGEYGEGFSTWTFNKKTLDAVLDKAWTLHDLRRTVATGMATVGVEPHIIEAVLNHQSGHKSGVAGTYNRSTYSKQMKTGLGVWAAHIAAITSDNVVEFKAAS